MRWTWIVFVLAACGSDDEGSGDTGRADTGDAVADSVVADTFPTDTADTSQTETARDTAPNPNPNCGARVCGPDPVLFEDCGACNQPGKLACNDGKCEATCDPTKCAAMGYSYDTCVSSGECDGSPEGDRVSATFACGLDGTVCVAALDALDCGLAVTDCQPCDNNGSDGRCQFDECMPALAVDCPEPKCPDQECGLNRETGEDCGECTTPGLRACNAGRCEPVCDEAKCSSMSVTLNTCVSSGECDGSPEGAVATFTYTCAGDRNTCDLGASVVDCGLSITDCAPCDLDASDDGLCKDDACVTPDEAGCQ